MNSKGPIPSRQEFSHRPPEANPHLKQTPLPLYPAVASQAPAASLRPFGLPKNITVVS
jgi:hypothetical protein